jgi:hypothetical protein
MDDQVPLFMQITGCENPETAQQYLEFGGGELETAISLYMESGGEQVRRPITPQQAGSPILDSDVQIIEETMRAPIQPRREVLNDSMFIQGTSIGGYPPSMRMDPFPNSMQESGTSQSTGVDPIWEENDRLANLFQLPTDITFPGTFDLARTKAKKESKWLLVSIHDPAEFQCQVLNRDLWKAQEVKDLIKESFVFVQVGSINAVQGG